MNDFLKHTLPYSRRFGLYPVLLSMGYRPQKTWKIDKAFAECNYSIILSGCGYFLLHGKLHEIVAPCVLIEWPGETMYYGPDEGTAWEEFFLIYPGEALEALVKTRTFLPREAPVRRIENPAAVRAAMDRLAATPSECPDRIDEMAWQLVMSTFAPAPEGIDPLVREIESVLQEQFAEKVNFTQLASRLGVSQSSMRRRWAKAHGETTFSDYRAEALLRRSCSLLAESSLSIKEIAEELGFEDHFYFIRRFRKLSGMTPTGYRKRYTLS